MSTERKFYTCMYHVITPVIVSYLAKTLKLTLSDNPIGSEFCTLTREPSMTTVRP